MFAVLCWLCDREINDTQLKGETQPMYVLNFNKVLTFDVMFV